MDKKKNDEDKKGYNRDKKKDPKGKNDKGSGKPKRPTKKGPGPFNDPRLDYPRPHAPEDAKVECPSNKTHLVRQSNLEAPLIECRRINTMDSVVHQHPQSAFDIRVCVSARPVHAPRTKAPTETPTKTQTATRTVTQTETQTEARKETRKEIRTEIDTRARDDQRPPRFEQPRGSVDVRLELNRLWTDEAAFEQPSFYDDFARARYRSHALTMANREIEEDHEQIPARLPRAEAQNRAGVPDPDEEDWGNTQGAGEEVYQPDYRPFFWTPPNLPRWLRPAYRAEQVRLYRAEQRVRGIFVDPDPPRVEEVEVVEVVAPVELPVEVVQVAPVYVPVRPAVPYDFQNPDNPNPPSFDDIELGD